MYSIDILLRCFEGKPSSRQLALRGTNNLSSKCQVFLLIHRTTNNNCFVVKPLQFNNTRHSLLPTLQLTAVLDITYGFLTFKLYLHCLQMELYIGLSKDTEINITLNQLYHFHGLILKYKQDLVSHLTSSFLHDGNAGKVTWNLIYRI